MASDPVPLTQLQQLQEKISRMQSLMMKIIQALKLYCERFMLTLHKNEDLVHMISEEEIGKIVSGLARKKE